MLHWGWDNSGTGNLSENFLITNVEKESNGSSLR